MNEDDSEEVKRIASRGDGCAMLVLALVVAIWGAAAWFKLSDRITTLEKQVKEGRP